MSDEIERARAVLESGNHGRSAWLLGSCWPELLAVVEACEAAPMLDWQQRERILERMNALRARLREHLGSGQ